MNRRRIIATAVVLAGIAAAWFASAGAARMKPADRVLHVGDTVRVTGTSTRCAVARRSGAVMIECLPTSPTAGSYATVARRQAGARRALPDAARRADRVPCVPAQDGGHLQMNAGWITETCRIAWWKGYVKGRFVCGARIGGAPAGSRRRVAVLALAQGALRRSPPTEARHGPRRTDRHARRVGAGRFEAGQPEVWYERVLERGPRSPSLRFPTSSMSRTRRTRRPIFVSSPPRSRASRQAVARLRSEAAAGPRRGRAPAAVARREAEGPGRAAPRPAQTRVPPAANAAAPSARPGRRQALWIVLELASVVLVAAGIFLVLLDSDLRSGRSPGLTAGAVVLGTRQPVRGSLGSGCTCEGVGFRHPAVAPLTCAAELRERASRRRRGARRSRSRSVTVLAVEPAIARRASADVVVGLRASRRSRAPAAAPCAPRVGPPAVRSRWRSTVPAAPVRQGVSPSPPHRARASPSASLAASAGISAAAGSSSSARRAWNSTRNGPEPIHRVSPGRPSTARRHRHTCPERAARRLRFSHARLPRSADGPRSRRCAARRGRATRRRRRGPGPSWISPMLLSAVPSTMTLPDRRHRSRVRS